MTTLRDQGTEQEQDMDVDGANEEVMEGTSTAAVPPNTNFSWSADFSSFAGQGETYLRVPGPTFSSHDPSEIFCKIWDPEFMETVAKETNKYAEHVIGLMSDPAFGADIPKYLDTWTKVTVEDLYRFFALIILMSFCSFSKIQDFWATGWPLGMPAFREFMPRNRYLLISKFLHFADNNLSSEVRYARKIEKVKPVLDHCNRRFAEMYTPAQHLSLEESLLLWKGRLSWKQCIRSKAARFGIKTFELCEAETGYLLQFRVYVGKTTDLHPEALHGFQGHTAKVVLDLMENYLNVGHVVVMDNWYNQLPLTRHLKSLRTDVLGTMNRRRVGVPLELKSLNPRRMERGESVGYHSGDIALVSWKDVKIVTVISTYHQHQMVPGTRAGQAILKPIAVRDYNRYMGGVDLKDQKLSMFLLERKRGQKWYMKMFRRLVNTSLLNAFIIYTRNPMYQVYHRRFRLEVVKGLFSRYPSVSRGPSRALNTSLVALRLQPGKHFPIYTENAGGERKHKLQLRCARCTLLKKRSLVTTKCELCKVPLCLGKCRNDYHSLVKLD